MPSVEKDNVLLHSRLIVMAFEDSAQNRSRR
jgi:hypothetical protein